MVEMQISLYKIKKKTTSKTVRNEEINFTRNNSKAKL